MKKRALLLCAAALLVAAAIVGGSLAATSATGAQATNEMTAQTLRVNVTGTYTLSLDQVMPGDTIDADQTTFTVTNTAQSDAYIRVTVRKYWVSQYQGQWAKNLGLDANMLAMGSPAGNWLTAQGGMLYTGSETQVYFYAQPLAAGAKVELPLTLTVASQIDDTYANTGVQLQVTVDAVQYVEGENELNASGILSTFGVAATLNADGSIQSLVQ